MILQMKKVVVQIEKIIFQIMKKVINHSLQKEIEQGQV